MSVVAATAVAATTTVEARVTPTVATEAGTEAITGAGTEADATRTATATVTAMLGAAMTTEGATLMRRALMAATAAPAMPLATTDMPTVAAVATAAAVVTTRAVVPLTRTTLQVVLPRVATMTMTDTRAARQGIVPVVDEPIVDLSFLDLLCEPR